PGPARAGLRDARATRGLAQGLRSPHERVQRTARGRGHGGVGDRPGGLRGGARLRAEARAIRAPDRGIPGPAVDARRHVGPARGGAASPASRRALQGRISRHDGSGASEDLRGGDGEPGHERCAPDLRLVGLFARFPDGAPRARCAHVHDRGRNGADPAHPGGERAPRAQASADAAGLPRARAARREGPEPFRRMMATARARPTLRHEIAAWVIAAVVLVLALVLGLLPALLAGLLVYQLVHVISPHLRWGKGGARKVAAVAILATAVVALLSGALLAGISVLQSESLPRVLQKMAD